LLAERDETVHPSDILILPPAAEVVVRQAGGTHALPHEDPHTTSELIEQGLAGRAGGLDH
jgi:hypothetical protein